MALSPTIRFSQFKGINNIDDPIRLHEGNRVSGLTSLVEAENVDVDKKRMLSMRGGFSAPKVVGVIHSIWANENEDTCFFVEGTELKQLLSDYSTRVILSGLNSGLAMSYVEINDIVAITNSQIIGYIKDGEYSVFTLPPISSRGQGRQRTGRGKVAAKPGHLIESFQNRILVAIGDSIFYSDSMVLHSFDNRKNYHQFNGYISMIKAVTDGVYVSDSKNTYFLAGGDFAKPVRRKVADYMAFDSGAIKIEAEELQMEGLSGRAVLWMSEKGVCVGTDGGHFANLTKRVYSPGSAWNKAAGLFRKDKDQFITSIHN